MCGPCTIIHVDYVKPRTTGRYKTRTIWPDRQLQYAMETLDWEGLSYDDTFQQGDHERLSLPGDGGVK